MLTEEDVFWHAFADLDWRSVEVNANFPGQTARGQEEVITCFRRTTKPGTWSSSNHFVLPTLDPRQKS